jgi:hypothetical protein
MQNITDTQVINIESARMFGTARMVEGVRNVEDVQMILNHVLYIWEMAPQVPAMYCANALRKAVEIQERSGSAESAAFTTREWELFRLSYNI